MSARWKLTVRRGPRVERATFGALADAVDGLEERARTLSRTAHGRALDTKIKRFAPEQQVLARLEVTGPQRLVPTVKGGLDVRGDGSVEAYRGRVRRQVIVPQSGETPYSALRRVLG